MFPLSWSDSQNWWCSGRWFDLGGFFVSHDLGPSILHLFLPLVGCFILLMAGFPCCERVLTIKGMLKPNMIKNMISLKSQSRMLCQIPQLWDYIYLFVTVFRFIKKKKACFWCVFPIHVDNRSINYRVPRWLICHLISEDQMSNWRVVNS